MNILVVDDRLENRILLQKQLEPFGHAVVTAENGAQALAKIRSNSFDLVVSDLLMPVMDGYQLCYSIKTDPGLNRTPVVLYTATYLSNKDEQLASSLGADDLIGKPIEPDEFLDRIHAVVERRAHGDTPGQIAPTLDEKQFLREYNGQLIQSMEDRLILAEANQNLKALNRELEKRVERATSELQQSHDELQSANARLSAANKELESFTYSVSHDLRAPARAIQGLAGILKEELHLTPGTENARILERIERNAEHMDRLIHDLLQFSRLDTGLHQRVPLPLGPVVQQSIDPLQENIRSRHATIVVAPALPTAIADETALARVIDNLLDNALKFVPKGTPPRVEISARQEAGFVTLSVRDNGRGIPPEYHERIFKIFERLPTPESVSGTGVGLAIVRKAVERMGGTCGVESAPGAGSTFWIKLPAAR